MDRRKLERAVAEALRFTATANALLASTPMYFQGPGLELKPEPWNGDGAPVLQGNTRRASMDLTRVLADLRRRPS